jgi:ketosteroid isomerase-like protein
MKPIRILFAAALCAAITLPASAQDAAVRRTLDANYTKFIDHMKKKDTKAIVAMSTKDFTWKQVTGKVLNLTQAEAAMKEQLTNMPPITGFKNTITSLKLKGDTAVASTNSMIRMEGKDPQGKTHLIEIYGSSIDTWKKIGADWKMHRVEDLSQKVKVDGKELPAVGSSAPLKPATPNPNFTMPAPKGKKG